MSFAVRGLLQNSNTIFGSVTSGFTINSANSGTTTKSSNLPFSNSLHLELKIDGSTTSTESSTSTTTKKEEIESRTSNSLLTSSLEISKRESITEQTSSTISAISSLNEEINNEASPIRKASLTAEAETLISDLNSYINSAISEDSNLSSSVVISSVSPTDKDLTTSGSLTSINIQAISTLSDLGLSSLDFSDYEATSDALSSAALALSSKLNSYGSSSTSISTKVDTEVAQFNLEVKDLASTEKSQVLADLANSVVQSITNFTLSNTTPTDTVLSLVTDLSNTDRSDNEETESTLDNEDAESIATSQGYLHTYQSSDSSTTDESLNVQA